MASKCHTSSSTPFANPLNLASIAERIMFGSAHQSKHTRDTDCTVDPDTGLCVVCGVLHGDPCEACGGRGYHTALCPFSEALEPQVTVTHENGFQLQLALSDAVGDLFALLKRDPAEIATQLLRGEELFADLCVYQLKARA